MKWTQPLTADFHLNINQSKNKLGWTWLINIFIIVSVVIYSTANEEKKRKNKSCLNYSKRTSSGKKVTLMGINVLHNLVSAKHGRNVGQRSKY